MNDNAGSPEGDERDATDWALGAPCAWCDYNGAGYWQAGTHREDCPWHRVGGEAERKRRFRSLARVSPNGGDQPDMVEAAKALDLLGAIRYDYPRGIPADANMVSSLTLHAERLLSALHPPALRSGSRMDEIAGQEEEGA